MKAQGRPLKQPPCVTLCAGHHVVDFWTNICICHNLIVEPDDEGLLRYQGPSPDEVALVEGAAQLGFSFVSRTREDVTISFQGHQVGCAPFGAAADVQVVRSAVSAGG